MRSILLFIGLIFLFACSDRSAEKKVESKKSETPPKEVQVKKEKKGTTTEKLPFLTMENCTELLTAYGEENEETKAVMTTPFGEIEFKLYENTPVHRANFVYLTKQKYFDETVFYRVVDTFMIQGGNSDEWETQYKRAELGNYKLKPEMDNPNFHKRGALCAARSYTDNPGKLSSPFIFYIVQRGPILPEGMDWMEQEEGKTYTPAVREHYIKFGGTPGLDGEHTVFGEVSKGLDLVDSIARVEVDGRDWPKEDVWIRMRVE
jgi:peptidyl-prolyl cis-trans isomerase A (cyclophilin A)